MIKQMSQIKDKLQNAWQSVFPKTISGQTINLSANSGVIASIKHIAKFNNSEGNWDVCVRHARQSRGTSCLVSRNEIKLATLDDENAVEKWLSSNADQLEENAAQYLSQMGYKAPEKSFPVLKL